LQRPVAKQEKKTLLSKQALKKLILSSVVRRTPSLAPLLWEKGQLLFAVYRITFLDVFFFSFFLGKPRKGLDFYLYEGRNVVTH
jgi:hypothetical protein